eukprot:c7316_g1_i1 orf=2-181(+)
MSTPSRSAVSKPNNHVISMLSDTVHMQLSNRHTLTASLQDLIYNSRTCRKSEKHTTQKA